MFIPVYKIKRIINGDALNLFLEVKALSFLDGNLNYHAAQNAGLNVRIAIEEQQKNGKRVASGEMEVSPYSKNKTTPSARELIEIFIDKLNNNIKPGQFVHGDTVLLVDIKQLLLDAHWQQSSIALYQEKAAKSIASGVLWNALFGREGNLIFKPIECEGLTNIDSPLRKNGVLVENLNIKGVVFATYHNFTVRKYVGFFRDEEQDQQAANFIATLCDFYNDDLNSQAWQVLQDKVPLQ